MKLAIVATPDNTAFFPAIAPESELERRILTLALLNGVDTSSLTGELGEIVGRTNQEITSRLKDWRKPTPVLDDNGVYGTVISHDYGEFSRRFDVKAFICWHQEFGNVRNNLMVLAQEEAK